MFKTGSASNQKLPAASEDLDYSSEGKVQPGHGLATYGPAIPGLAANAWLPCVVLEPGDCAAEGGRVDR